MGELLHYTITDRVAVVTIDNPPVNALSPAVWTGIDEAVARANADAAADAIVLIGAGTTFIAGADIKVFDVLKTRDDSMKRSAGTHELLRRLEDSAKPLVAAIHGNALGGGMEVAMSCHFRVAARDAKVGQQSSLGIIPAPAAPSGCLGWPAPRWRRRTDGKPVAASKARAAGMIDEVVESDLLPGAIAFAKEEGREQERGGPATSDDTGGGEGGPGRVREGAIGAGQDRARHARAVRRRRRGGSRAPAGLRPGLHPRAGSVR
jgi:3-hydroxyacyl-CoA dehydrogenase